MIDIKDLEAFIAILDGGSISQAALSLGLTQPAISLKLKKMEQELNIQLFQRTSRQIIPLDAARSIEAKVRNLIANFDSIKEELAHSIADINGTVRVGSILGWAVPLMIPSIKQVMGLAPKIRLRMCVHQTAELMHMLLHGQVDFAIVAQPFEMFDGLESFHLLDEDLVIVGCNVPNTKNENSFRSQVLLRPWVTLSVPDLLVEKYWKFRFKDESFPWNQVNVPVSIDNIDALPRILATLPDALAVVPKQVVGPHIDGMKIDTSFTKSNELHLAYRSGSLNLKRFDVVRQSIVTYVEQNFR